MVRQRSCPPAQTTTIEMIEVTDPRELAEARHRREQFDLNSTWLQAHIAEIYGAHRGKVVCVAGQEVFAANTAEEAIAQAKAAHPEDLGKFTRYIPKVKAHRVYAL